MKTTLKGRTALILGVHNAPGRSCAQQLSRIGCRVVLASTDGRVVEKQFDALTKKGGEPHALQLSPDPAKWDEELRIARDEMGHLHIVVNAWALASTRGVKGEASVLKEAASLSASALNHLNGRGPLKAVTLWPDDCADSAHRPIPAADDPWHSLVSLGPHQALETEVTTVTAETVRILRPGSIADAVVALLMMPPSVCPRKVLLGALASSERGE